MWRVLAAMVWVVPWQGALLSHPQNQSSLEGNIVFDHIALTQILDEFKKLTEGAEETRSCVSEVTTWFTAHRDHQDEVTQGLREIEAGVKNLAQQLRAHLLEARQPGHNSCGIIVDVLRRDIVLRGSVIQRLQLENTKLRAQHSQALEKDQQATRQQQELQTKLQQVEEEQQQITIKFEQVKTDYFRVRSALLETDLQHKELKSEMSAQMRQLLMEKGRGLHLETVKVQLENKTRELQEEREQQQQLNKQLIEARKPLEESIENIENEKTQLLQDCMELGAINQQLESKNQETVEMYLQLQQRNIHITEETERLTRYISQEELKLKKMEEKTEEVMERKEEMRGTTQILERQDDSYQTTSSS
nr:zinc finger protein 853-like isoform X1 [Procambarus clarkii]